MDINNICMSCFKPMGDYDICANCGWEKCMQPKEAYHLHPGMILENRYIMGVVLGCGGFGVTYKAYDTTLGMTVAIKEYYPAGLVNRIPGEKEVIIFSGDKLEEYKLGIVRFLSEARHMAKFDKYPYMVKVYDFFEANHTAYIVMEYLDGCTLKKYLSNNGEKISFETAYSILEPILRAVEEMHKAKLLHRDLSPDNIHITTDNRIKLYDFGAARLEDSEQELTRSIVVKVGYTPPEQYRSKSKQGAWTDVYALGATFYRCVTGILPEESIDRLVQDTLKKPSELNIKMPLYAEKAIMKAMALKEGLRFKCVKDMRLALADKRKVDYPEIEYKKRKRIQIIAASLCCVLLLSVLGGAKIYKQVMNPKVTPTTVTVWVPGKEQDDNIIAMNDIAAKFESENTGYQIDVKAIEETEYAAEIKKASDEKTLPCLYKADAAQEDYAKGNAELKYLQNTIESKNYYFLRNYKKYFKLENEMPTACSLPVIYYNNYILSQLDIQAEAAYANIEAINALNKDKNNKNFLVIDKTLLENETDDIAAQNGAEDALEKFTKGDVCFYIGTSDDLRAVQAALPGYFGTAKLSGTEIAGEFKDIWCVAKNANKNTEYASMIFINYLLSDYAQNVMYIQRDNGIPLSKSVFKDYIVTNSDLDFLQDVIEKAEMQAQ
ncbi:MAG: serine/threonine-protein kinase [Oscillospiraceae bacterium]